VRALGRIGIVPVRQRGSHIRLAGFHDGESRKVTVPANRRIILPPDLASILRQAGLTQEELEALLDR